jgi:WD40 repeat protein
MDPQQFYTVGGTLTQDDPSYVVREADAALFDRVKAGGLCFVLTTRQMGKSSLMARTAQRLRKDGAATAIVDLSRLGADAQSVGAERWYYSLAYRIASDLRLDDGLKIWWEERLGLTPSLRLFEFLRDVVLARTSGPVVVFVDEIDSTLGLPFTDDFFAAIRSCHNARAEDAQFQRLTFVLLGVASPSDLIADPTRTPFNVGTRIDLTDFTLEQALPLATELGGDLAARTAALRRVLDWTGGHPYLTQKVCLTAAERSRAGVTKKSSKALMPEDIDRIVDDLFFTTGADLTDDNLKFVCKRLTDRGALTRRLLRLYRRILSGRPVTDDATVREHNELKLSGVVKVRPDGTFAVRNKVYARVFDRRWIRRVRPADWTYRTAVTLGVLLVLGSALSYELIYPRPDTALLRREPIVDDKTGRDAYDRLRRVPFYGPTADNLWGEYGVRRMNHALDLDEQPGREGDAYRLAMSARRDLKALTRVPAYAARADALWGEFAIRRLERALVLDTNPNRARDAYRLAMSAHRDLEALTGRPGDSARADALLTRLFERRAIEAAYQRRRDAALLWRLKVLTVQASDAARRAAGALVGSDFERLITTNAWSCDERAWLKSDIAKPDDLRSTPVLSAGGRFLAVMDRIDKLRAGPKSDKVSILDLEHPEHQFYEKVSERGPIATLALSPDGHRMAVLTLGAFEVFVVDLESQVNIDLALPTMRSPIANLAFSPDGRSLAGSGKDGVCLWDLSRLKSPPELINLIGEVPLSLSFSRPDGRRLAGANPDGIWVWDLGRMDAKPLHLRKDGHRGSVVAFSPDGHHLASDCGVPSRSAGVRVWDLDRPDEGPLELRVLPRNESPALINSDGRQSVSYGASTLDFSPDGRRLAYSLAGLRDPALVLVWALDRPNDRPLALRPHHAVETLAFRADGRLVLAGGRDQATAVSIWKSTPPERPPSAEPGIPATWSSRVVVSPDGRRLAVGGASGVTVLDTSRPKGGAMSLREGAAVEDLAFSTDGRRLAVATRMGASLWDLDHVGPDPLARFQPTQAITAAAFSPDNRRLALVTNDRVLVYDPDRPGAGPTAIIQRSSGNPTYCVAFSHDDRRLAVGSIQVVLIYDVDRPDRPVQVLPELGGVFHSVAFSLDGRRLVVENAVGFSFMHRLDIRDLDTPHIEAPPDQPPHISMELRIPSAHLNVAFTPDGGSVVMADGGWVDRFRIEEDRLVPEASRLLPGYTPGWSSAWFRFADLSDPSGNKLRAAVLTPEGDAVLTSVRFDGSDASPVPGDPAQLLEEWQKKLGLTIGEDGQFVPRGMQ